MSSGLLPLQTSELPVRHTEELGMLRRQLGPYESISLTEVPPLLDQSETYRDVGIWGASTIALVEAGPDWCGYLLDTTASSEVEAPFAMVSASDLQAEWYMPIREGRTEFGRGHKFRHFGYPKTVSHTQFAVESLGREVVIHNADPARPTYVSYATTASGPGTTIAAVQTGRAIARVASLYPEQYSPPTSEAPHGYYRGMPILGRRSTVINGGVYLGGGAREAIVVDADSPAIRAPYLGMRAQLPRHPTEFDVALAINAAVRHVMPYSEQKATMIASPYANDRLVALSRFFEGVCRHHGLLAAALVEMAIADSITEGTPGIERNSIPGQGPHAWGMQHGKRQELVIDAAQNFVGTKKDAKKRPHTWDYEHGIQ